MTHPKPLTVLAGILLTLLILGLLMTKLEVVVFALVGRNHPTMLYFVGRSFFFLPVFFIWFYAVKVEKQPLLIWKEQHYPFFTCVSHIFSLFIMVLMSSGIVTYILRLILHKQPESEALHRMVGFLKANQMLLIFTALVAGITEELIFRGYLLPRLELLTKSPYIAVFISSLIFGLGHFGYGTIQNVVGPFIIGVIQAVYYWRYRNINVVILFHFLWDLLGLYYLSSRDGYNF